MACMTSKNFKPTATTQYTISRNYTSVAISCPGAVCRVAMLAWVTDEQNHFKSIQIPYRALEELGISRYEFYSSLRQLEKVGIVQTAKRPGHRILVKVLRNGPLFELNTNVTIEKNSRLTMS